MISLDDVGLLFKAWSMMRTDCLGVFKSSINEDMLAFIMVNKKDKDSFLLIFLVNT